jgi:hypothetical protein
LKKQAFSGRGVGVRKNERVFELAEVGAYGHYAAPDRNELQSSFEASQVSEARPWGAAKSRALSNHGLCNRL